MRIVYSDLVGCLCQDPCEGVAAARAHLSAETLGAGDNSRGPSPRMPVGTTPIARNHISRSFSASLDHVRSFCAVSRTSGKTSLERFRMRAARCGPPTALQKISKFRGDSLEPSRVASTNCRQMHAFSRKQFFRIRRIFEPDNLIVRLVKNRNFHSNLFYQFWAC